METVGKKEESGTPRFLACGTTWVRLPLTDGRCTGERTRLSERGHVGSWMCEGRRCGGLPGASCSEANTQEGETDSATYVLREATAAGSVAQGDLHGVENRQREARELPAGRLRRVHRCANMQLGFWQDVANAPPRSHWTTLTPRASWLIRCQRSRHFKAAAFSFE